MRSPSVSVIVPIFDDRDGLEACLAALARQTYAGDYEVVVVDNGSPAALGDLVAAHPPARLVSEPRVGSYAARNTGIASATGDVLAFTDADCVPDRDWLTAGVGRLVAGGDGTVVAGEIRLLGSPRTRRTAVELHELHSALRQRDFVERRGFGATANLFASALVFQHVGRFDPALRSGGDWEWGERVAAAGFDIVYEEGARVTHPMRTSLREFRRRKARIAGGYHYAALRREHSGAGLAWALLMKFIPPVDAIITVGTDPRFHGFIERIKVAAVEGYLRYVEAWEMLRLTLGGTPRR